MKSIPILLAASLAAASLAGCANTYVAGDGGPRRHEGYRSRHAEGGDRDWVWRGARVYCRGPDERFQPCGVRD